MPTPTGLTRPQIGSGRASPGTVDASALSNPDQGTDGLRVHVQDPSRAHMAATIGIVDAGGYYLSDEVEGALQEIGGASSGGRQNGVVTGFGYSAVGLVVTFNTPSTALLPTLRTYSGVSVTLPNNTPSVWVYISPATGNITQFVGANPPTISGPENVLLWQFGTGGGNIINARDARLYVRNLDRKLPFTVRSVGPQADQESEACFVTLDAVLTYLTYATPLNGRRTEVVIRGPVNTGFINLPPTADGLHFRGEDGGALILTSGPYLIDTQGRDGVTFADLLLQTDVPGATAIIDTVGSSQFLSVTRCDILSGTSAWQAGIVLPNSTGQLTVSNSRVSVTNTGISTTSPNGALVDQVEVVAINFVPGSIGIRVGNPPVTVGERPSTVRSCTVTGFETGIVVSGVGHVVTGNTVIPGTSGFGISVGTTSTDITVSSNRVDCSVNAGLVGIRAEGTFAAKVTGVRVTGNTVYGARSFGIQYSGFVQESSITDNQVDCNVPASPTDPTAVAGIYIHSVGGPTDIPSYNTVSGNTVWRAKTGIYFNGSSTQVITGSVVSGNMVHHCAVGTIAPPIPTVVGDTSVGIGADWCASLVVSSNTVYGIGRILTDAGAVLDPTPALVSSVGIQVFDSVDTTVTGNQVDNLSQKGGSTAYGVTLIGTGAVVPLDLAGIRISDNGISNIPSPSAGILVSVGAGTATVARNLVGAIISGNSLRKVGSGIEVGAAGRGTVTDLRVDGNTINDTSAGSGISVSASDALGAVPSGVVVGASISDNTVSDTNGAGTSGIGIGVKCGDTASVSKLSIDRNSINNPSATAIELSVGTPAPGSPGAALFEYVSVSGNEIDMGGAVAIQAIRWVCIASATSHIQVSDNTISNADTGFEFFVSGAIGPTDSLVSDLQVNRNKITSTNRGIYGIVIGILNRYSVIENTIEAGQLVCSLAVQPVAAVVSTSNNILLARNTFRSVPVNINTLLQFTNHKIFGLKVEDNTFYGGSLSAPGGFALSVTNSDTGTLNAVRNLLVRRNSFRDMGCPGILVSVSGPTDPVVDTAISDNNFDNVASDPALARASVIRFVADAIVRNLAIRNNQASTFGHPTTTYGGIDITVGSCLELDVTGNQFNVTSSSSYGNIINLGVSANPGVIRHVSINNNKSSGVIVPVAATPIPAYIHVDLRGASEVSNVSVCDNDIDRLDNGTGNTAGIRLWADGPSFRVAVDRNRVNGVNIGAVAISPSFEDSVDGLSVCGNHVAGDASGGSNGAGINVYFQQTSLAVRVSDNTIIGADNTPGYGMIVQTSPTGVALNNSYVERNVIRGYQYNLSVLFGACTNLAVSGNQTSAHVATGIEVVSTGNAVRAANLSVNGNRVATTVTAQLHFIRVDMTGTNTYENLSVCDNDVQYNGGTIASNYGIYVESATSGSTRMLNANICRNRILTVNNGIRVGSGETSNVRIDDNEVRDVLAGITHVLKDDVFGYSVSRNAVQARTDSSADGLIYIFHDAGTYAFHEVSIDGNIIGGGVSVAGSTHGGNAGIRVAASLTAPNGRSVSISNNQIRLTKTGINASFASANAVAVDNNRITRTLNGGIDISHSSNGVIGNTLDVSISGNLVTYWCESAAGSDLGIKLFVGTNGANDARGITMANNNCHTEYDTATAYYIYLGSHSATGLVFANNIATFPLDGPVPTGTTALIFNTAGSGPPTPSTYKNFVFTGNVFRGSVNGISYAAGPGGTPSECTFMGNIGDNIAATSWGQFANGGGAGWTTVYPLIATLPSLFNDINNSNGS